MAATTRPRPSAALNGAGDAAEKAKHAAKRSRAPAIAAGAAAAGLAGGLLIGSRVPRRRSLAARAVAGVQRAVVTAGKASTAVDDLHAVREQLDAMNRRSPIEVVLDGLTHRRGAHKHEG
jgi:hypothetical protein